MADFYRKRKKIIYFLITNESNRKREMRMFL